MPEQDDAHSTFPEVLKRRVKFYEDQAKPAARRRNRTAFVLWRRYNGDYYGVVDEQLDQYIPVPDDGLMKYPIIGPAVRANDANWLATQIKHEITGASSAPE